MNHLEDDLDRYPIATGDDAGQVPVIDLSELRRDVGSPAARPAVDAIASAASEWGFFQVVGHGVPGSLIDSAWRETRAFFGCPRDQRLALERTRDNPWGYYDRELTKNQRDKKAVFDYTVAGTDPIYGANNRWPAEPTSFREALEAYRDAVTALSESLLAAFCVGLDLPPDHLHAAFGAAHTGFIRLNYYPVADPAGEGDDLGEADLGVHHHTDAGALTVLLQDAVSGLQVFKSGLWHNVAPLPGAFVINTGDMMQVWSNDRYRAAMHRVLAMEASDRYSIPFFYNPAAGTVVEPLPSTVTDSRPAQYHPIPWSRFRGARTDGDYADYGPEVQIAQFRV